MKTDFKFALHSTVGFTESAEAGIVIGRAEFTNISPQYLIRYQAGDSRMTESWWDEDSLRLAPVETTATA